MDCQKLIVYGILLVVGLYVLRDVCGVKLPFVEGFENLAGVPSNPGGANANANANAMMDIGGNAGPGNASAFNAPSDPSNGMPVAQGNGNGPSGMGSPSDLSGMGGAQLSAAEPSGNEFHMPIQGIQTAPANCYPQNTLTPQDLLPEGQASQIESFNEEIVNAFEEEARLKKEKEEEEARLKKEKEEEEARLKKEKEERIDKLKQEIEMKNKEMEKLTDN